jgi:hypothetical protein
MKPGGLVPASFVACRSVPRGATTCFGHVVSRLGCETGADLASRAPSSLVISSIHSLKNPKKYFAVVDSPNIFFKDTKRCPKMSKGFAALSSVILYTVCLYESDVAGTASISQAR